MRQILAFLTCDTCQTRFGYDDSVSGSNADSLASIMRTLELFAELSGWHAFRAAHRCRECTRRSGASNEFTS